MDFLRNFDKKNFQKIANEHYEHKSVNKPQGATSGLNCSTPLKKKHISKEVSRKRHSTNRKMKIKIVNEFRQTVKTVEQHL